MTPGARVAAAAEIIDRIAGGAPVEKALTGWARSSRFAGSKDRRAVRDLVFDVVRRWWSTAWVGGAETGRARMLGALLLDGADPEGLFTGEGHAPAALSVEERAATRSFDEAPEAIRADLQPWVFDLLCAERGPEATLRIAEAFRSRASVHLRANLARTGRDAAMAALADEGITATAHPSAATALEVMAGATRVSASKAYLDGLVELQDAASQAVVEALAPLDGVRVLDFCAGGGGKSLALAALGAEVVAHDIDPGRMRDVPSRASRAGVADRITLAETPSGTFDLVLADAPCSGSGAWRRQPEAKLRITPQRLSELNRMQDDVLRQAARHVAPGGRLAYATCSILQSENRARVDHFLAETAGWTLIDSRAWSPEDAQDGFFLAILARG